MPDLTFFRVPLLAAVLGVGGCAFISSDQTAEALKANADKHASFQIAVSPTLACPKAARMLSWCAGGPNYHYRCHTSGDGSRAELSGTLEAIYRTEYFMVTEFVKGGGDTTVTVHQHDSVLVYDYAPMMEAYFAGTAGCQPR
ncbi:MAG: hypothetical protein EPN20_12285 [Magnetospirillum sp.]|nr:MAG: hypothetical protein EPN20_12285 [Magnetospirillum sp.]